MKQVHIVQKNSCPQTRIFATRSPAASGLLSPIRSAWRRFATALGAAAISIAALLSANAALAGTATLTTLHLFNGFDGSTPAGLMLGSNGNFYGATNDGGDSGLGTIFTLSPSGVWSPIHSFAAIEGTFPPSALTLILGIDGSFYGTTSGGGANGGYGTVFTITPAGMLTTLHAFNGIDGAYPAAGLVLGRDGNFYGTTPLGGANGLGTVFCIGPGGGFTTLHSFSGSDGAYPYAALTEGADSAFYGTTAGSGSNYGTVFSISAGGALTTLHAFKKSDGAYPFSALLKASDGNFYGTTEHGGARGDYGTLFKVTPSGVLTTLHSFMNTDGAYPVAPLIEGRDGAFYGSTIEYAIGEGTGTYSGTVFMLTAAGALTTLHEFTDMDGAVPVSALAQADDGSLYGTTTHGGIGDYGTIFKLQLSVPAAPTDLVATGKYGRVKLSWGSTPGAATYAISIGTRPGGESSTPVATGITNTTATITGLLHGTTYYFTVVAVNSAGTSLSSNEAGATTR